MVIWYIQAPENLLDYNGASYSQILQLNESTVNNYYSLSSKAWYGIREIKLLFLAKILFPYECILE